MGIRHLVLEHPEDSPRPDVSNKAYTTFFLHGPSCHLGADVNIIFQTTNAVYKINNKIIGNAIFELFFFPICK